MKKIEQITNIKINHKLIIKVGLIILALLFVVGIYQIYKYVPGVKEAVVLATTKKPETFTELYFEDHTNLPNSIKRNQENKFKFTIHNLEYKDMDYPYVIYADYNGNQQMIDQGSVFLKQDEYKSIEQIYILNQPIKRIKIVVNLINKNQQIAFWMGEE